MKDVQGIDLAAGRNEEILPDFSEDFPYIATRVDFVYYVLPSVPWHWHKAIELFYMEEGDLQYTTPGGVYTFPKGSAGLVNSGVLHSTRWKPPRDGNVQLLHLFDTELLSGRSGSRIDRKYIQPLVYQSGIEILPLYPDREAHRPVLQMIRSAFDIPETAPGYELKIRQALCDIWLSLLAIAQESSLKPNPAVQSREQIKQMMIYVHEHFAQHISVDDLAAAAHLSKRACFRVFQDNLHMTPVEYIRAYRLQAACRMLAGESLSITEIAYRCGLGSSSYFGKVFREEKGCTPLEYRRHWQDRAK